MKNINKTLVILGALIVLPYFGMAAEKAMTVNSLQASYVSQETSLDAQIASSTSYITTLKASFPQRVTELNVISASNISDKVLKEQGVINALKQDKHTLEITYQMIFNSMQ